MMPRTDRLTMGVGAAALLAMAVMLAGCAAGTKPASEGSGAAQAAAKVEYLFVQTAHRVTFDGNQMVLHDVIPVTLFFSDRPERISGHGATAEVVRTWGKGDDSFAADAPNAALCILGDNDDEIAELVVVLREPRLAEGNLTYLVEVLDGEPPASGGASTLFIDVIGRPLTPISVAGMSRRVARRTSRRVARRH